MNDPNDPSVASPDNALVHEVLDGLKAGEPLAEQVEAHLNVVGGPVSVDDAEVAARADRVLAQLRGAQSVTQPASQSWRWAALAAVTLMAVGAWSVYGAGSVESEAVVDAVPVAPLVMTAAEEAASRPDTLVLDSGAVSIHHGATNGAGVHRVYLAGMDVTVEPVGTVYHTGIQGDLAVVWVEEGRVRLRQGTDGHLGLVDAGGWAVLSAHTERDGIQVDRLDDGPVDPVALGLDPVVAQLMAEVRWTALDADTRAAIVGGPDAP